MAEKKKTKTLKIDLPVGTTKEEAMAQMVLRPAVHAGMTLQQFMGGKFGDQVELDIGATITGLVERAKQVTESGDVNVLESMLATQATTLDVMFQTLLQRGIANMREGYGETAERYFKLGLKAQAQCRAAAETLIEAKNPRPVFVGQNNIANNQQVNNNDTPAPARGANRKEAKRSIEHEEAQRVEPGAPQAAGAGYSWLDAVGAKHGTKDA